MHKKLLSIGFVFLLIANLLIPFSTGLAAGEDQTSESLPDLGTSPLAEGASAYAYVSHAEIDSIIDGSAPWDLTDTEGNDSSESNGIVRTYDTVVYNPKISVSSLSNENYTSGDLYFQVVLPMDITRATFNLDYMAWLTDFTIEYYKADGTKLATGTNALPKYSANEASGSTEGTNSYKTEVAYQRLTGKYTMRGETAATVVIPGTQTLSIGIYVSNACNGDLVEPTLNFWMDGNSDNLDKNGNAVDVTVIPDTVTVSAKARYNVKIAQVSESYCNLLGYYDLENGTFSKTNADGLVRGRLQGYGVSIQLFQETDNPNVSRTEKGFKGIELPQGEISYDIKWTIKDNHGNLPDTGVSPILWDYSNNSGKSSKGNLGRNLNVDGNWSYAVLANPLGSTYSGDRKTDTDDRLYKAGTVNLEGEVFYDLDDVAGLETPTYRVTTSNYDFDLDTMRFPRRYSASGTSVTKSDENIYVGTFATNYFGVILQYQSTSVTGNDAETIYLQADVSNLNATSLSGTKVTTEVITSDNSCNRSVTMYVPGGIAKSASFTAPTVEGPHDYTNFTSSEYAPDGAVVLGGQVGAWSRACPTRSGDTEYVSSDTLMKFDSRAFSIDTDSGFYLYRTGTFGTYDRIEWFYAADPLFPDGYDSNDPTDFERMNTATTADYTYFKTLEDLEKAGFTCCAILMETRNQEYLDRNGWRDHSFRVIFNVTEESAMIGKTACIIPFVEAWTNERSLDSNLTWADNATNNLTKVDRSLTSYKNSVAGRISGTKIKNDPSLGYVKAEFNQGGLITGTHMGGDQYGNSVSIVGYQTSISAKCEKTAYDMGYGERTATWTIAPSSAYKNAATVLNIVSANKKTDLTITISTEDGHALVAGSFSMGGVSLRDGSGVMVPYSFTDAQGKSHTSSFKASYMYDSEGNLVITCTNVVAGVPLPEITVSTSIGNPGAADDVENNQVLSLTAKINGTGDDRPCTATNGNIGTATTRVIKLNATALFKTADKPRVEVEEDFTQTITYLNINKESEIEAFRLIDHLPYNGDGRGSNFNGTYKIGTLTVTLPDKTAEVYICEGKPGTKINDMTWGKFDSTFTKIGQTSNGTFTTKLNKNITGIAIKAEGIALNEKIKISYQFLPEGNRGGDVYNNNAMTLLDGSEEAAALTSNIVQTIVVQRSITGTVWIDDNQDGTINDGEERLSGITVTLYKLINGKWTSDINDIYGNKVQPAKTDDMGGYTFSNLLDGTYKIVFSGFKKNLIGITKKEVDGGQTSVTSKAEDVNGSIEIISTKAYKTLALPKLTDMTNATYTIPYMNVGVIYGPSSMDLAFTKTDEDGNALKGAKFALYACTQDHGDTHPDDLSCIDWDNPVTAKSDDAGLVDFTDIEEGEYILVETRSPFGYDLPGGHLCVSIIADKYDVHAEYKTVGEFSFDETNMRIVNYKSNVLPGAGMSSNPWVLILTAIVMIAVGPVVMMIRKKIK